MNRKTATAAGILAAGILTVAGCSSSSDDGDTKGSSGQKDPTDAVLKAASAYQKAANALDWTAACRLSTKAMRDGTVEECAARNTPDSTPTAADSSSPSPSYSPPTYADGSTPNTIASSTPSGPDRADTGPVKVSDLVEVPASGAHPSGYGVLVSYTVTWPGKESTTTRRALRLVDEGGAWLVDQHEDIQEGDEGHGSPVRTALSGG
ncbi:hypothetical protein QQY66_48910 [Streptomyces sp. DG2A-72]|uniref:hypothetical protein n=1 Tax=Streptomyces sp. DG2A-72 TaxID=3051386 RepID=UPI00265BF31E|nr:hypothetical protein [Streptomyces sp. DG2A-72]MDO0939234.1 hypothetical protein [Streptomyces sp. DG2A-72]